MPLYGTNLPCDTDGGSTPAISVVISTVDRHETLALTLDSLLIHQRLPHDLDYEVIVVDNDSRDETRQLVDRLIAAGHRRLRYLFEPRRGVSYGRNAGIAAARAPIVAFTDDDNAAEPEWLANILEALATHPDVQAVGGPIAPEWLAPRPAWIDERHWSPLAILDYGADPFETSRANPRCLLTANLAVRREVLDDVGLFSPAFARCQDHEWLIRFWQAGHRALYAPHVRVSARVPAMRMTRRYHRDWHARHGVFAAAMRLQEIVGRDGSLRERPVDAATVLGVPGFVYRELATEMLRSAGAWLRGRPVAAFHHGNRVRYLWSYIRHRIAAARSPLAGAVTDHESPVSTAADDSTETLSPGRLLFVHALFAVLLGGSAWDIWRDQEHWPFSQYPMFASVDREPTLTSLRLYGVAADASATIVPLLDRALIAPLDQCRLSTALARTYNNPARRALTQPLMQDVLTRYEQRRRGGHHDGPPLAALRLYAVTWPVTTSSSPSTAASTTPLSPLGGRPREAVLLAETPTAGRP